MRTDAKLKAMYAKQIVENPIWPDIYKDLKMQFFDQFCENTDMESRERIAMAMDVVDEIQQKLVFFIVDGEDIKVGDNADGS
jgi:hypothetical protein